MVAAAGARPGGMMRAVVTGVDPEQATLRIGRPPGPDARRGRNWTGRDSLTRLLRRGDLVLVRLPAPLPSAAGASSKSSSCRSRRSRAR